MAVTRSSAVDSELAEKQVASIRLPGYANIYWHECRAQAFIFDINPRFAGDYPLTDLAGLSVPAALSSWARADQPQASWLQAKPSW